LPRWGLAAHDDLVNGRQAGHLPQYARYHRRMPRDEDASPAQDLGALLEEVERRRLRALVEGDVATAEILHADDYQLITPGGAMLSKSDYLAGIADETLSYRRFEPEGEVMVRMLGSSAAAVRYRVAIEITWEGGADSGRFWHTDLYELRDGRWQAVWSHATRIRAR
jgi:phosphoglucomutase